MKHIFHNLCSGLIKHKDDPMLIRLTELFLPPIVLSISILLSTYGPTFTLIFLFLFIPIIFNIFHHKIYQGNKIHSSFYVSWAISSFIILISVFEFIVVPFLEITIWENYSLLLMVSISIGIIIYLRKRSISNNGAAVLLSQLNHQHNNYHHEHQNGNIHEDDKLVNGPSLSATTSSSSSFYSLWISSYIYNGDLKLYLVALVSIVGALLFEIYLNITTICHTYLLFDFLLVPDDCSEVYFDFNLSLSFVTAIYAALLVIIIIYSLLKHMLILFKQAYHGRYHHHLNQYSKQWYS